jgi:hypothetical protein
VEEQAAGAASQLFSPQALQQASRSPALLPYSRDPVSFLLSLPLGCWRYLAERSSSRHLRPVVLQLPVSLPPVASLLAWKLVSVLQQPCLSLTAPSQEYL